MNNSVNQVLLKLIYGFKKNLKYHYDLSGTQLAPMHLRAIQKISEIEQCTSQNVADAMKRDKSQVTRLVVELIDRELLVKTQNPNDKRSQFLSLTSQGEAELAHLIKAESDAMEALTRNLNDEEVTSLVSLINKMVED